VNGKDVVFVEDDLVALVKFVESSFIQRIVHDAFEPLPITLYLTSRRSSRKKLFT